jgi:hypothetical protein
MSVATLEAMKPSDLQTIANLVNGGATLYVRGGFQPDKAYPLVPFLEETFVVELSRAPCSYQVSSHTLISAALRNEGATQKTALMVADVDHLPLEPMVLASGANGARRAAIFALNHGAGVVIYDLQQETGSADQLDRSILERLADPEIRTADLGALAATERASGRDVGQPVPCGVVLADRPTKFDYLQCKRLEAWLNHARLLYEDVHTDFAWTPSESPPSPRYLEILKRFKVGFVWHGFYRYLGHYRRVRWDSHLEKGRRSVTAIEAHYGIRFQPIMIFPFERANPEAVRAARREGFCASYGNLTNRDELESFLPSFMRYSTPLQPLYGLYYPVLRSFPASFLNYDQMLAVAALGLPIVLTAYPEDLRLHSFMGLRSFAGSVNRCDGVLRFAAAKGLRPLSLEQIAQETIEASLHREGSNGREALHAARSGVRPKAGSVAHAVT